MDEKKRIYEIVNLFWSFLKKYIDQEKTDSVWLEMMRESCDITNRAEKERSTAEWTLIRMMLLAAVAYFEQREKE